MPDLPYRDTSRKVTTELRLIASLGGREYVHRRSTTDKDTPEGMKLEFEWLSNERAVGDFVRVESQEKIVERVVHSSEWQTVLDG